MQWTTRESVLSPPPVVLNPPASEASKPSKVRAGWSVVARLKLAASEAASVGLRGSGMSKQKPLEAVVRRDHGGRELAPVGAI